MATIKKIEQILYRHKQAAESLKAIAPKDLKGFEWLVVQSLNDSTKEALKKVFDQHQQQE